MYKSLLSLILLSSPLLAIDGYEVYKKHCSICHIENITKDELLKNLSKMKAPPMVEISSHIKANVIIKEDDEDIHRRVVVLFIKDYIANPSLEYSMCNAGALEHFGVMPSQKDKTTDEERQAVAEWIYDRYDGVKFK